MDPAWRDALSIGAVIVGVLAVLHPLDSWVASARLPPPPSSPPSPDPTPEPPPPGPP